METSSSGDLNGLTLSLNGNRSSPMSWELRGLWFYCTPSDVVSKKHILRRRWQIGTFSTVREFKTAYVINF